MSNDYLVTFRWLEDDYISKLAIKTFTDQERMPFEEQDFKRVLELLGRTKTDEILAIERINGVITLGDNIGEDLIRAKDLSSDLDALIYSIKERL